VETCGHLTHLRNRHIKLRIVLQKLAALPIGCIPGKPSAWRNCTLMAPVSTRFSAVGNVRIANVVTRSAWLVVVLNSFIAATATKGEVWSTGQLFNTHATAVIRHWHHLGWFATINKIFQGTCIAQNTAVKTLSVYSTLL
jgi:hypothetical protein